jgi:stringent starvation protein B
MISNKPYLLRALFEWILDNEWTPHLQVDAHYPGIQVPFEYAHEGVIVLNIHPNAVRNLQIDNEWIAFKARFNGIEQEVSFVPAAVMSIFARESGQGMPFPPEPYPDATDHRPVGKASKSSDATRPDKSKKPHLSVVK